MRANDRESQGISGSIPRDAPEESNSICKWDNPIFDASTALDHFPLKPDPVNVFSVYFLFYDRNNIKLYLCFIVVCNVSVCNKKLSSVYVRVI